MFNNYYCSRCGAGYQWEQMTSTTEGNLLCPECLNQLHAKKETKRQCPVDGAEMQQLLVADIVLIDRCSECGGTWFDGGELEIVRKRAEDDNWYKGFIWGAVIG